MSAFYVVFFYGLAGFLFFGGLVGSFLAMAGVLLLGGVLVVVASLFWFFWSLFFRFSIDCGAAGLFVWWFYFFCGEFDPGSGRTLAACLTHASRTMMLGACTGWISGERVSNT